MKTAPAGPISQSQRPSASVLWHQRLVCLALAPLSLTLPGPAQAGLLDKLMPAAEEKPKPEYPIRKETIAGLHGQVDDEEKPKPEYPIRKVAVPEPPPRGVVRIDFSPTYDLLNMSDTAWLAEPAGLRLLAMSGNMFPVDTRTTLPSARAETRDAPPGMEVEKPGGHYVPREFSTRLKVYLKDQMGILVTPTVATRLVDDAERCEQPISEDGKLLPCASNSELEALMKLVKSLNGGTIPNLRFDAYLSVEQLGLVWDKVEVIVVKEPATEGSAVGTSFYNVRPRYFEAEKSICQEKIELDVPSYKFYADLIRLPDAAFIGRITERRAPGASNLTVEKWLPWKPVTVKKSLPELRVTAGSVKAEVVVGYTAQSDDEFVCNGIQDHYDEIRLKILHDAVKELPSVLTQLFDASFANYGPGQKGVPQLSQ